MAMNDEARERANFAADAAWQEMKDFLRQCDPPKTPEERERTKARFLELQQRADAKAQEIFNRFASGDPAPHLTVVAALNDAHAEMNEAIAAYTPTAIKELSAIAFDHIQKCWGDRDVARKIWAEAFAEGDRALTKAEESADRE
jgi:hypothetical protein